MKTRPNDSGFRTESVDIKAATAESAIRWAHEEFGTRLCLMASMQDAVVMDLAMRVDRSIRVVFLDNGYHFPETLATLRRVEARYGIRVDVVGPLRAPMSDPAPGDCCDSKPGLLERALEGYSAWISGIRRDETATRREADVIEFDRRGLVKVNPLAQWAEQDVAAYILERRVVENPLHAAGYTSIGCEPCTSLPDATGGRSGRWAGSHRVECGLHA